MKAQFGLTTLIIFIALIATAAIAAGVILYTTGVLQQRALTVGAKARERVATGLEVFQVNGYQFDPNTQTFNDKLGKVTVIGLLMRLAPGSKPINFNDLSVLFTDENEFYSVNLRPLNRNGSVYPLVVIGKMVGDKILITGCLYDKVISTSPNCTIEANVGGTAQNLTLGVNVTEASLEDWIRYILAHKDWINHYSGIATQLKTALGLVGYNIKNENVYLEEGEVYELFITLPGAEDPAGNSLEPNEYYEIRVVPREGQVVYIEHTVPSVLPYARVTLYPT